MGCWQCCPRFGSDKNKGEEKKPGGDFRKEGSTAPSVTMVASDKVKSLDGSESKKEASAPKDGNPGHIAAQTFTFSELAAATKNFRQECLLGEGGFGRVYKGRLESTGQVVAVKQLDRNGLQGNTEFLVEVHMLSLLHHPNLVSPIGYCADGDQRLLVYEFMPLGSLEDHLHDVPSHKEPLDWNTRMKIAAGAARGLEYLHDKANPPVIYRDFKSSNILLDEGYFPKLSDFGLTKLGPVGDKTHVSTRVMGTYGYCAPEYAMAGQLTLKSDVYSLGVVFLELITGRKAIDSTRPTGEQNLVAWARLLFKDRRKFPKMADPLLQGHYPMSGLYQALTGVYKNKPQHGLLSAMLSLNFQFWPRKLTIQMQLLLKGLARLLRGLGRIEGISVVCLIVSLSIPQTETPRTSNRGTLLGDQAEEILLVVLAGRPS